MPRWVPTRPPAGCCVGRCTWVDRYLRRDGNARNPPLTGLVFDLSEPYIPAHPLAGRPWLPFWLPQRFGARGVAQGTKTIEGRSIAGRYPLNSAYA